MSVYVTIGEILDLHVPSGDSRFTCLTFQSIHLREGLSEIEWDKAPNCRNWQQISPSRPKDFNFPSEGISSDSLWHVTCDITPPVDPQWQWESCDNDGANQSTDCTHFIVWTTHWSLSNLIYAQAKSFHSAVKVQLMIWPDVAYFQWYYVYMCLHINIFECVNISTVRIRGSNLCIKL